MCRMTFLRRTFPKGTRDILQSLDPEEIRHLVSVRRRATPLQDLLRPRKTRSQGSKAALQLHPSPSRKCSLPTGYSALTRVPGHGCLSLSPDRQADIFPDRTGAAPARNPDARVGWGISRSRSSGMDPGGWVSLQVGTLWTGTTLDWAPKRT